MADLAEQRKFELDHIIKNSMRFGVTLEPVLRRTYAMCFSDEMQAILEYAKGRLEALKEVERWKKETPRGLVFLEERGDSLRNHLRADGIKICRKDAQKIAGLSNEEELSLLLLAQTGDTVARQIVIKMNLWRIVVRLIRYREAYPGIRITYDDVLNEGVLALIYAIDIFNPDGGIRFPEYRDKQVRQAILDNILDQYEIKVPSSELRTLILFLKIRDAFGARFGRMPQTGEMAKRMQITVTRAKVLESESGVLSNDLQMFLEKEFWDIFSGMCSCCI